MCGEVSPRHKSAFCGGHDDNGRDGLGVFGGVSSLR